MAAGMGWRVGDGDEAVADRVDVQLRLCHTPLGGRTSAGSHLGSACWTSVTPASSELPPRHRGAHPHPPPATDKPASLTETVSPNAQGSPVLIAFTAPQRLWSIQ